MTLNPCSNFLGFNSNPNSPNLGPSLNPIPQTFSYQQAVFSVLVHIVTPASSRCCCRWEYRNLLVLAWTLESLKPGFHTCSDGFRSSISKLGRPLGHFIFSLLGFRRILFFEFFRGFQGQPSRVFGGLGLKRLCLQICWISVVGIPSHKFAK